MTLTTWISLKFTRHVIIERSSGLFLWLANRSQKPLLKWYPQHKNPKNVTIQLQTLVGSRDNLHDSTSNPILSIYSS